MNRLLILLIFLSASALAAVPSGTVVEQVNTGSNAQTIEGQRVFHSSGTQDTPLVGFSESGAPAGAFSQSLHFDSPALTISRTGTTGGETASSPTVLVQASQETTPNTPIMQIGGCLALSGDNWFITWGDGALSFPGGILDNPGKTKGKLSIDPIHRQLVGPDGITMAATWADGVFRTSGLGITNIPPSNISGYPNNAAKFLRGDGIWTAGVAGPQGPQGIPGASGGSSKLSFGGLQDGAAYPTPGNGSWNSLSAFNTSSYTDANHWDYTSGALSQNGTGTFTAPATGVYMFCMSASLRYGVATVSNGAPPINLSVATYQNGNGVMQIINDYFTQIINGQPALNGFWLARLNAGDVIQVKVSVNTADHSAVPISYYWQMTQQ